MKPRLSNPFRPHLFTFAALLAAPLAHAAPIIWGPATTISAATDVNTIGALNYAYNFNIVTPGAVNGVTFTGTNTTMGVSPNFALGSSWLNAASSTFGAASGTFNALSGDYKTMLGGGDYSDGATARTVTLQSLTSGRVYATQIWVNDSRSGYGGRTETVTSTGGNTVTLDYNNTETNGGVGQYTTGRFVADAATQQFSLAGNTSAQINAFQLREVTNIGNWVGTGGASWDAATTNNFASNFFSAALTTTTFDVAKAPLNSVTFADSYWDSGVAIPVTQTTVTVDAAGVSTGTVYFDNSAVNYTLGNDSGTIGITGTTAIVKNGSGTVTLNGANTYTGTTRISIGILEYSSNDNQTLSGVISGSGTLSKSGGGTLTLTSSNNSHTGSTPISGGILRIGGAGRLNSGNYAGAISFTNGSTLQYSSSSGQTLSGAITGLGGITKDSNTSDLTLSNAGNNYSGTTNVSAGRIVVGAATHLSSGATSIVQSGTGQLFVGAAVTISNPFNISTDRCGKVYENFPS